MERSVSTTETPGALGNRLGRQPDAGAATTSYPSRLNRISRHLAEGWLVIDHEDPTRIAQRMHSRPQGSPLLPAPKRGFQPVSRARGASTRRRGPLRHAS